MHLAHMLCFPLHSLFLRGSVLHTAGSERASLHTPAINFSQLLSSQISTIPQDLQSLSKTLSETGKLSFYYCSVVKHSLCIQITQTDQSHSSLLIKYWVSESFNPTVSQPQPHSSAGIETGLK